MFKAIMPNGEQIRLEAWVYREWVHNRAVFFDPVLGAQLATAVRFIRYR